MILFILYFPTATILYKTTFGKALCRLRVEHNGKIPYAIAMVLRETVYKILLVFVFPVYLIRVLNLGMRLEHLSGIFYFLFSENIVAIYIGFAIFILFTFYLISKKTWYDVLAGTSLSIVELPAGKRKYIFLTVSVAMLAAGSVMVFNHFRYEYVYGPLVQKHNRIQIASYVDFLKEQQDAKEYIFDLFENHDIVIISERIHYEMTQYDFYYDIISDPRFVNYAGMIFTETGCVNFQPQLDNLMQTPGLDEASLDRGISDLMKNVSISWPVWDKTNLFAYLKGLYYLNQSLPEDGKIKHFFTDIAFSWDGMTRREYREEARPLLRKRDKIMAENFINKYEEMLASDPKRKKCLVIMNYRHGFGPAKNKDGEMLGNNAGALIMDRYPYRSANVLINTVGLAFDLSRHMISVSPVQGGAWDNAFAANGNKPVGFNLKDTPFGLDDFDMTIMKKWKSLRYQDVFTGFVFYKPLEEHTNSMGFKGILSDNFDDIIMERASIIGDHEKNEFIEKLQLLKESEIVADYVSYATLRSKKDVYLSGFVLLAGLLLCTWKLKN